MLKKKLDKSMGFLERERERERANVIVLVSDFFETIRENSSLLSPPFANWALKLEQCVQTP